MNGSPDGRFSRMADLLLLAAREQPAHGVGFVRPDRTVRFISYPELADRARRVLKGLQDRGLRQGDIAILSLDTGEEIIPVLWACFLGGIVPALLQPPVSFSEYNPAAEKAEKVYRLIGHPYVILSHAHLQAWIGGSIPGDSLIDAATISEEDPDAEIPSVTSDDLALIQFSSGSTGDPKGVMLTHRNILHNVSDITRGYDLQVHDNHVSWMPLYHDMGLIGFHFSPLYKGADIYHIDPVDFVKNPSLWLDAMSGRPSVVTGCPNFGQVIVNRYLSRKAVPEWDLSGIRVVFNGAEPISVQAMEEFNGNLARFGYRSFAMLPCYGMAEATLAVTFSTPEDEPVVRNFHRARLLGEGIAEPDSEGSHPVQLVSLGQCLDHCSILIADTEGHALPENRVGQVWVQGENVTRGYYNNPEATAALLKEGWLHTGDLGFLHGGELFIMGRLKDVIFINGVNHYAHDLETIALQVEGVAYGRIVMAGYFDEKEGKDKVLVFMVASDNDASREVFRTIQQHFLKTAGLMIDTFIPIRSNEIPRTSSGKIQRYKMVSRFQKDEFSNIVRL